MAGVDDVTSLPQHAEQLDFVELIADYEVVQRVRLLCSQPTAVRTGSEPREFLPDDRARGSRSVTGRS